ncbi:helix-turn-helix domain-containing protein [Limnobaculum xujianqingii]|uniref:helix-turn-helix domain-containing protein n=1 Tax=Limnobaculum xujianqingii TaxID=2738837 RepID=UPI00112D7BE1|nr:helix-turn-helix transcriptional regulator [Limnobaculum xujianqingii]
MTTIGARLKEERSRMGLTQDDFAALGGVKRGAQVNYEKDERAPDANYLSSIANNGVDVQYILIGIRSQVEIPGSVMNEMRDNGVLPGQAIASHQLGTTLPIGSDNKPVTPELLDTELLHRIAAMLDNAAKQAGKRWTIVQLVDAVALVYNFLIQEENVNDEKIERTLRLVVNR